MGYKIGDIIPTGLKPFPADKGCRELGLEFGSLIVSLTEERGLKIGEVVAIDEKNYTGDNPYIRRDGESQEGEGRAVYIHKFAPLPASKGEKGLKPIVSATLTEYSDGVRVNEDTAEFDGKKWTRAELKADIRRKQEILRRPFATVGEKKATKKVTKKSAKKVVAKKDTKK